MPEDRPLFELEERSYLRSHPWISFKVQLKEASYRLWMLLGEACSNCEHIADTPLLPAVKEQLYQVFLSKGARATTAIEGSTLSEEEVRQRVRGVRRLPPSKEYMGKAVDNILDAVNAVPTRIRERQSARLTVQDILYYNQLVLRGLPEAQEVMPGQIRTDVVGVGHYTAPAAKDCHYLLERLCEFISPDDPWLPDVNPLADAVLRAIVAHLYIAWIHPFGDGNGRTARLVEFHLLVAGGAPFPAAHLLSNHYNETRDRYYAHLDGATRRPEGVLGFLEYALQGFVDGLRYQLSWITSQLLYLTWQDSVYSAFGDKSSQIDKRRREVALALIHRTSPVAPSAVRDISPRLAQLYANRQDRAISRDLEILVEMQLVRQVQGKYAANVERLLERLPDRVVFDNELPPNSPASR